jgi:NNP family nitrate/nitrite transporter-like MFS transporter
MENRRHVALGTISFIVCFAAWGLISAFAPRFREILHLSQSETALLVAVPVLLGSLARIPMGILTDRFGGRAIFAILMAAVAIPVWIAPQQSSYSSLLMVAFLLGLAGSSFAIGVGYVSRPVRGGISGSCDRGPCRDGPGLPGRRRFIGPVGDRLRLPGT